MKLPGRRRAQMALGRIPLVGRRWNRIARREWLLNMLPKGSVGAEIGVWQGDFSAAILRIVKPTKLHLIDPWRRAEDADDPEHRRLYARSQAEMDAVHGGVVKRFRTQIDAGVVVVHRARSVDAAVSLVDASLDWVYIDGDHSYEAVRSDLDLYSRKVRPGGFVAADDYAAGGLFGGAVKRAVDEAVAARALEPVVQRGRQFLLKLPT